MFFTFLIFFSISIKRSSLSIWMSSDGKCSPFSKLNNTFQNVTFLSNFSYQYISKESKIVCLLICLYFLYETIDRKLHNTIPIEHKHGNPANYRNDNQLKVILKPMNRNPFSKEMQMTHTQSFRWNRNTADSCVLIQSQANPTTLQFIIHFSFQKPPNKYLLRLDSDEVTRYFSN